MKHHWKILGIPPFGVWEGVPHYPDVVYSFAMHTLGECLTSQISQGSDVNIEQYASIWTHALRHLDGGGYERDLITFQIANSICGILGFQLQNVNHAQYIWVHRLPHALCDEIILRINTLFISKNPIVNKSLISSLICPISRLVWIVRDTELHYNDPEKWQRSVPTRLWLDLLREDCHRVAVFAALRHGFNHDLFKSTVNLEVADLLSIHQFLAQLQRSIPALNEDVGEKIEDSDSDHDDDSDVRYLVSSRGAHKTDYFTEEEKHFDETDVLRDALLALAMVKWPENGSEPSSACIKAILFGLRDDDDFVRITALHVAWAYRHYIHFLSNLNLVNELLEALLRGLVEYSLPDVKDLHGEDHFKRPIFLQHLEQTVTYYTGLIRSLLTSSAAQCSPLDVAVLEKNSDFAMYRGGFDIKFSLMVIIELFEIIVLINEGLRKNITHTHNPTDMSISQNERLWSFVSGWVNKMDIFFYLSNLIECTKITLSENSEHVVDVLPHVTATFAALQSFVHREEQKSTENIPKAAKKQLRKAREQLELLDALSGEMERCRMERMEQGSLYHSQATEKASDSSGDHPELSSSPGKEE
ncbi:hypothetical protein M422DRAFT_242216 [Sphaerobolus stellatus SS14]|nr:hypothetical protein M422DRAFT_242216 [Sphaerobolus stellatus SS14]